MGHLTVGPRWPDEREQAMFAKRFNHRRHLALTRNPFAKHPFGVPGEGGVCMLLLPDGEGRGEGWGRDGHQLRAQTRRRVSGDWVP